MNCTTSIRIYLYQTGFGKPQRLRYAGHVLKGERMKKKTKRPTKGKVEGETCGVCGNKEFVESSGRQRRVKVE